MTDLRQSPDYVRYLKISGWLVAGQPGTFAFIRKIPLTPISIIKIQRPKKIGFTTIYRLAKKYRAFWVYIEPTTNIQATALCKHGFRLSHSPFLPAKTIQLDLSQSLKKIKDQMKKDVRYSLRKAKKEEIKILKYKDIKNFHRAWPRKIRGWKPSLKNLQNIKKTFGKNAFFLAAVSASGQIIAGTVILIACPPKPGAPRQAYYYYAFTSKLGRQKLAQYWLVWQAIKEAKKRGCAIFDFEGIYDPRFSNKSWLGFSHFKHSFGGAEITYPGCFVKSRLRKVSGTRTNRKAGSVEEKNRWRRFFLLWSPILAALF